jgi:hypothetical protein
MMYRGRQHERDFREIGAASATASANRFGPDQSFICAAPTPQGPHWPAEHRTMESPRTADRSPLPAPQRRGGPRYVRDTRCRRDHWCWWSGPSLRRRSSQRRRGSAPQTVGSIDRSIVGRPLSYRTPTELAEPEAAHHAGPRRRNGGCSKEGEDCAKGSWSSGSRRAGSQGRRWDREENAGEAKQSKANLGRRP